jgi:NADH:ubiquinone oxidoreductase subunit E
MEEKIEIVICLGSSCFARGNKKTLQIIDEYIKQHKLEEQVYFHGSHCFGKCIEGPVIKIKDTFYFGVTPSGIIDILDKVFNK